MGAKQYGQKWRAYFRLAGKDMQLYFDTEQDALNMVEVARNIQAMNRPAWANNSKKRNDAKYQDLPVGFYQSHDNKTTVHGEIKIYPYIRCCFTYKGKPKFIARSYGTRRTREQAILELTQRVLSFLLLEE